LWVFRAPDTQPEPVKPELLPAAIEGLDAPYIEEIEVDAPRNGIAVRVRLTHYRRAIDHPKGPAPPLVLIHGYSASGSTYTHRSVPMPMAKFFALQGRDVWVLDLRTSAGMPSAVLPWHFEDAALADIPVAIARIRAITGAAQVDVFAHCIGAVMLSMALLTDSSNLERVRKVEPHDKDQPALREHTAELAALRGSVRKVVLSQKGPRLIYSDGNVLRAYLMRVLRKLVLPADYQFRPARLPGLADQVMDRVLSSLPYPDAEYDIENPLPFFFWKKTGWAALRHRMDALYAQDFEARHMDTDTLESLDHLFGPLNLDTVSQGGHFARHNTITNGAGRNEFVTTGRMKALWPKAGTLSIHGSANGLADPRTLTEMEKLMTGAGLPYDQMLFKGLGHQDCLVGKPAQGVFERIEDWL
ncbi:MAG: alpha/beta fold hydrolase, partial [Rhodoferax sp.]|nr:alpha/beta fold hydrolase [Rhodoferax sp.]